MASLESPLSHLTVPVFLHRKQSQQSVYFLSRMNVAGLALKVFFLVRESGSVECDSRDLESREL